jgi:hypothetical protein
VSSTDERTSRALFFYDPDTGRILHVVREVTYGNGRASSEAELREIAAGHLSLKGLDASTVSSLVITDPQLKPRRYKVDLATNTLVEEETPPGRPGPAGVAGQ